LLKYAPENRPSTRVATGKLLLKNKLQDSKIKPRPTHKLKTMKTVVNSDLSKHRQGTEI
jgi:hypothetical protein